MARAEPVDQGERQQQRRVGFFGRLFELPIRALGVLMLSLFFSLVMEWIVRAPPPAPPEHGR